MLQFSCSLGLSRLHAIFFVVVWLLGLGTLELGSFRIVQGNHEGRARGISLCCMLSSDTDVKEAVITRHGMIRKPASVLGYIFQPLSTSSAAWASDPCHTQMLGSTRHCANLTCVWCGSGINANWAKLNEVFRGWDLNSAVLANSFTLRRGTADRWGIEDASWRACTRPQASWIPAAGRKGQACVCSGCSLGVRARRGGQYCHSRHSYQQSL